MAEIIVKDNVRYTKKDAQRVDVVTAGTAVQTKVPVEDTDAWAREQAEQARAALQAELDATREKARADLEEELSERRAEFEREIAAQRTTATAEPAVVGAVPVAPTGEEVPAMSESTEETAKTDEVSEDATKVVDPEVKKVREPSTKKSRTSGEK